MSLKLFTLLLFFISGLLFPLRLTAQSTCHTEGTAVIMKNKVQGNITYSGEAFNSHLLTGAHLSLPFGALISVTNTVNNKTIRVKINERGPFNNKAVIALSPKAFDTLGLTPETKVIIDFSGDYATITPEPKIYYLFNPEETQPSGYGVQIGSFTDKENIFAVTNSLKTENKYNYFIQLFDNGTTWYRLIIGDLQNLEQAKLLCESLKEEFPQCFVVNFVSHE